MSEVNETPLPHADLIETLTTVLNSVSGNKRQVVSRAEELTLELANNVNIQRQFDAMIHTLQLLLGDPNALQAVADRLAADEAAKVEVPAAPQPVAVAADSEGSAAPAVEAPAVAGDVGTDANGSPVAVDASAAS